MAKHLTPKQDLFAATYVTTGKPHVAYVTAYDAADMKSETIDRKAQELLKNGLVAARIAELRAVASEKLEFGVTEILRHWVEIATADPNDLVQHRLECCRHCYGLQHGYQWVDMEYAMACAEAIEAGKGTPDAMGGFEFNANNPPAPSCPMCAGKGKSVMHALDTRKLEGPALRLYAGVKRSKDGLQILMHSQEHAREMLAKYFGMFKDKLATPPTNGVPSEPQDLSKLTPTEAAKEYQKLMG